MENKKKLLASPTMLKFESYHEIISTTTVTKRADPEMDEIQRTAQGDIRQISFCGADLDKSGTKNRYIFGGH